VPHDHPDSNYRMARVALLSRVPLPDDNIHAIPTEGLSPEHAAAAYDTTLKRFYGADMLSPERRGRAYGLTIPRRAGIAGKAQVGGCGHRRKIGAAHLPDLPGARQQPRRRIPRDRDGKRAVVAGSKAGNCELPAAMIRPVGRLHWFTDRAATPEGVN
jgi:6-phosphogluconolactonase